MFMAENVSASFADFRRMRVASAVTRERRGSHASMTAASSVASSTSPLHNNMQASNQPSAAVLRARKTFFLQQEYLRKAGYGLAPSSGAATDSEVDVMMGGER